MIDHNKIEDAIDSYFKNTPTAKIIENLDRHSADREKDLDRENINRKTANNRDLIVANLVRFEEVSPANQDAAFLAVSIHSLVAPLGLPLYEGYDDLDEMWLTFLTLPSGKTVTLVEYLHSPQPGVCISVDAATQNIPQVIFESCRQLQVSREEVLWFHPDWQDEIDRLYAEHGSITKRQELSQVEALLLLSNQNESIDCFHHALRIYTREDFPLYWAMLQHNLGLAYFARSQGDCKENLEISIECFNKSLSIYTRNKFPEKWKINQDNLGESQRSIESIGYLHPSIELLRKKRVIEDIINRPISNRELVDTNLFEAYLFGAYLSNANLSGTNLSGAVLIDAYLRGSNLLGAYLSDANLSGANLSGANLRIANLSDANLFETNISNTNLFDANLRGANLNSANLSGANLSSANLTGAKLFNVNLNGAIVEQALFGSNLGISVSLRQDLIVRGAIFDDCQGNRSDTNLVPR
jgi:uncharacterized protein YjbI with pentapeptide repeats